MQTSRPALVVSIHDVSPLTKQRVSNMLDDLLAVGLGTTSLLVIPNHHHRAPMAEDPSYCNWVRALTESGPHEAVLHGYFHRRPAKVGADWKSSLITEKYTAGEGEFFDLTQAEAAEKLSQGRLDFETAGLTATGFIAPAWLLGAEAEEAVRASGFLYTTRLGACKNLATGQIAQSQSLCWSVRAAWRRWMSLVWNALLVRRLANNPLLRIGLHPPDWDHPAIKRQILALVRAALAGREAMTYHHWVSRSLSRP